VKVIVSNSGKSIEIQPKSHLAADYLLFDSQILPIRSHDFEALNTFLPTLEKDGLRGFNIEELMNFEFFCSTNQFKIENAEYKDRVLASKNVDVRKYINDFT
jgi:hypothetical protein